MKVNEDMVPVICKMEKLIGYETYNPNSYNGWTCEEGCSFRYPINYCRDKKALKDGAISRTKYEIEYIDPECINTIKYTFGSNHLYIGSGIVKMLGFLEERYQLDFNDLERQYIQGCIEKKQPFNRALRTGKWVVMDSGKWKVGVDIDAGNYVVKNNKSNSEYLMLDIRDKKEKPIKHVFSKDPTVKIELHDSETFQIYRKCSMKKIN